MRSETAGLATLSDNAAEDLDIGPRDTEQTRPSDHHLSRQHRLETRSGLKRMTLALTDWIEAKVAKVSVLPDVPVYAASQFAWAAALQTQWQAVRGELDVIMPRSQQLPNFQEILPEVETICNDDGWKTYWLFGIGMDCSDNQRQCPRTTALLKTIPGMRTAFFSILAPGKHIPAHRGAYNGLLRLHLAVKVPKAAEQCRIRIANEIHHWQEGQVLIFDDSFQHEVWNDTDETRAVLFVDFARPLRQPWHWLNERLLDLGHVAPFLRKANDRHRRWTRQFHR